MIEHRPDDRFAAIRGPCRVRAGLKTGAPIGETEATEARMSLKLDQMLTAGFGPAGVFAKQRRIDTDLSRDECEHWRGRRLREFENAAGMTEHAKLNGVAQPVARPPPSPDEIQIVGVEHIVAGHFGRFGRNGEQPGSLLGR
jgi:hypothetical protein